MNNRLTAILLTLCLALSLAACSSGKNDDSAQTQESSSAEESETSQESDGEEEPEEEPVSESVASSYGLTVEEFMALKKAVQTHIDSEWDAETVYFDRDGSIDLAGACDQIRMNISEDLMDDAAMENFIDNELDISVYSGTTDLWKERITVLAHAVNDWAAQQSVDYDTYSHVWDKLADYIIVYNMAADDGGVAPLFDLASE